MSENGSEIIYEVQDRIRIITLNRPKKMNALTLDGERELSERLVEFRDDPEAWVLVITGAGKAFSAGLDLSKAKERVAMTGRSPTLIGPDGLEIWKPIIAAINGYAVGGGCEMALACDIRIAGEDARIGLPEVKRAWIPGAGGIQRLQRMIPHGWAMQMLLTGDWVGAEQAEKIGLVQKVVPNQELLSEAVGLAERICKNGPLAVRAVKEAAVRGADLPLRAGMVQDKLISFRNRQTEDAKEGPRAFVEKRKPEYKGK